jgi:hypothetical protein
MKKILIITIALLLFNIGTLFSQTMLREIPLKQQIEKSSLVIEGQVIAKKSVWNADHNNIYTIHTVKVYKVFKGDAFSTIEVTTSGGKVDDVEQIVIPNLKLNVNDMGLFTLHNNGNMQKALGKSKFERFNVYSSLQGFYKYDLARDVISSPFSKKQGISNLFYDEITSYTKTKFIEISSFNAKNEVSKTSNNKIVLAPDAITFDLSTATAGTGEVLTISGTGFGSAKGKVGFRDADSGGNDGSPNFNPAYIDALDSEVLTWTNTQITVKIPSSAGTGNIRVTNNDLSEGFSNQTLTISYALINTNDGLGTQHFSADGTGSITWRMNTNFNANTAAKESFLRAFETWRCETGINWVVGANTSVNVSAIDGISLISFDNASSPLPEGTLGQCSYVISSCSTRTVRDIVGELDIVFDDDINDPSTPAIESWYFGNDPNGIDFTQWDFQSVALHELGHGHQLGHVINTNNVMHFSISNFEVQRELSTNDINAAGIIQNFSTTTALCSTTQMTNYTGNCSLSIEEDELENAITIFPNPARNQFFIKNNSFINLEKVAVYDLSGRLISEHKISNASRTEAINIQGLSIGVYIINIHSEKAKISTKLVID